jgi:hypothetical protein
MLTTILFLAAWGYPAPTTAPEPPAETAPADSFVDLNEVLLQAATGRGDATLCESAADEQACLGAVESARGEYEPPAPPCSVVLRAYGGWASLLVLEGPLQRQVVWRLDRGWAPGEEVGCGGVE